jgi:hypothetical protein
MARESKHQRKRRAGPVAMMQNDPLRTQLLPRWRAPASGDLLPSILDLMNVPADSLGDSTRRPPGI